MNDDENVARLVKGGPWVTVRVFRETCFHLDAIFFFLVISQDQYRGIFFLCTLRITPNFMDPYKRYRNAQTNASGTSKPRRSDLRSVKQRRTLGRVSNSFDGVTFVHSSSWNLKSYGSKRAFIFSDSGSDIVRKLFNVNIFYFKKSK